MGVSSEDKILDLGAGTGRNDSPMISYLSEKGRLIAVDISGEMITQLRARFARSGAVHIVKARVDRPLPLKERFDKVFISFVLHGFPQESREIVIENAYALLRGGGSFFILDSLKSQILGNMCYYPLSDIHILPGDCSRGASFCR